MTLTKLAKLSNVSKSTISRIEHGGYGQGVSYNVAHALCRALGTEINEIFWPNGLSHLGRPLGSKDLSVRSLHSDEQRSPYCPTCFVTLPPTGQCDFCF
ncbi:MAG: helix-turn-helix transcriptional regulator [Candidatus Nomurabacteria bacterium]|nr:MAG: helix-turn-helix transcriptional regulator [Candidatus Nomurabacteria bacterium]